MSVKLIERTSLNEAAYLDTNLVSADGHELDGFDLKVDRSYRSKIIQHGRLVYRVRGLKKEIKRWLQHLGEEFYDDSMFYIGVEDQIVGDDRDIKNYDISVESILEFKDTKIDATIDVGTPFTNSEVSKLLGIPAEDLLWEVEPNGAGYNPDFKDYIMKDKRGNSYNIRRMQESSKKFDNPKSWSNSKKLTYKEAQRLALAYYNQGGDSFYECWDEKEFNEFLEIEGREYWTVGLMKSMFHMYDEVDRDMRGSGEYQEESFQSPADAAEYYYSTSMDDREIENDLKSTGHDDKFVKDVLGHMDEIFDDEEESNRRFNESVMTEGEAPKRQYIITGVTNEGERKFYNVHHGWGSEESATLFDDRDTPYDLVIGNKIPRDGFRRVFVPVYIKEGIDTSPWKVGDEIKTDKGTYIKVSDKFWDYKPNSGKSGYSLTDKELSSELKEGNPVSRNLPEDLDAFLQDIAQVHGTISYKDITRFNPTEGSLKTLRKLYKNYKEESKYYDEDAERAMELIARDVAELVGHVEESLKESSLPTRNSNIDLDRIALDIWSMFQPEKLGEDNWIEFDYEGVQKTTSGTEVLTFRAIGPNDQIVKGAMRSSNNHLFVRAGDDKEVKEFFSVDDVASYIQSKFIKTECMTEGKESEEVIVGIYGDEVPGFESVDALVAYFEKKGIKVLSREGDMESGWDLTIEGKPRTLFFAVVNAIPGYNSDSVQEFIDQYRIDESLNEGVSERQELGDGKYLKITQDGAQIEDYTGKIVYATFDTEEDVREYIDSMTETLTESTSLVWYSVINEDNTYAGVPCETYEEARELAAQKEGRKIFELREVK